MGEALNRSRTETVCLRHHDWGRCPLAVGLIAVIVISNLIVEKTPSQVSAGAFPCNNPAVIAAAEKAVGIKKGPPDDLNLRNARDVRYDEAHDVMFCRVDLFRGNVIVNDYKYPVGFTFMAKAPSGLLVEPSITVIAIHLADGELMYSAPSSPFCCRNASTTSQAPLAARWNGGRCYANSIN